MNNLNSLMYVVTKVIISYPNKFQDVMQEYKYKKKTPIYIKCNSWKLNKSTIYNKRTTTS